jgi:hypothetical protein
MANNLEFGAQSVQVGSSYRWRSVRHIRYGALAVGLAAVNVWLWAHVINVAVGTPENDALALLAALGSTLALGLAISLWRNPPQLSREMVAVPALRHTLATHQAGHIVAAHVADPTRLRRASLTGHCNLHPPEVPVVTESALRAELTVALGGMVAEEIFAGESGTHAAADLERATCIAAAMVGRFGMAESPVSMVAATMRRRRFVARVLDDPRARKDLEALLRDAKRDTVKSMLDKRHVVIAVRDALLRHRRVGPADIRMIIARADRHRHNDGEVLVDLRVIGGGRPATGAGN